MKTNRVNKRVIKLLKEGDERSFEIVYEEYYKLVKHVVFQILPDHMIADDLTQETFFKVFENINSYANDISFSAWICTIARNLALNEKRKRVREVHTDLIISDNSPTPDDRNNQRELLDKVKEVLGERDYNLIILRQYYGLSYKEISEMTNESIAALTNRYHRAIKKVNSIVKL